MLDASASSERRGRKPRNEAPATALFCVRLTPAEREALERVARANHTTACDVLRDAVNDYAADCGESPVFSNL